MLYGIACCTLQLRQRHREQSQVQRSAERSAAAEAGGAAAERLPPAAAAAAADLPSDLPLFAAGTVVVPVVVVVVVVPVVVVVSVAARFSRQPPGRPHLSRGEGTRWPSDKGPFASDKQMRACDKCE